jgi:SAM-dependent methyltransferase
MRNFVFRRDAIIDLCKGKTVLHFGFLGHYNWEEMLKSVNWLHSEIHRVAKRLVGIDYLKSEVDKVRSNYALEAYACDVMELEKLNFQSTFDIVLCGEIIEHLDNPGLFLEKLRRFLSRESMLIITTPNPWWVKRMIPGFAYREKQKLNREHVMWQSYFTLKYLLERYRYYEIAYGYYAAERNLTNKNLRCTVKSFVYRLIQLRHQRGLFFVAGI